MTAAESKQGSRCSSSPGPAPWVIRRATRQSLRCRFTAVCSTRNVEMVRSLGADHVIDYTREDFADGRVRYDGIIDVFGRNSVSRLRRALTPRGRLMIVGGE